MSYQPWPWIQLRGLCPLNNKLMKLPNSSDTLSSPTRLLEKGVVSRGFLQQQREEVRPSSHREVSHPMLTLLPCPFFSGCLKEQKEIDTRNKNYKQRQKPKPLIKTTASYSKQRNPIAIAQALLSWFLFSTKMWLTPAAGPPHSPHYYYFQVPSTPLFFFSRKGNTIKNWAGKSNLGSTFPWTNILSPFAYVYWS